MRSHVKRVFHIWFLEMHGRVLQRVELHRAPSEAHFIMIFCHFGPLQVFTDRTIEIFIRPKTCNHTNEHEKLTESLEIHRTHNSKRPTGTRHTTERG
jgi:hypothetical protein